MIYAGGLTLLLLTSVFYLVGSVFFVKARREICHNSSAGTEMLFTPVEWRLYLFIAVCSAVSLCLLATGAVSI